LHYYIGYAEGIKWRVKTSGEVEAVRKYLGWK
jgi:hypothetical protein